MNDYDWIGGRVLVSQSSIGWTVDHEPASGGSFTVAWFEHKAPAIRKGRERAERFTARLFVEMPLEKEA